MNTKKTTKEKLTTVILSLFIVLMSLSSSAQISVSIAKKSYNGSDVSCFGASDAQLTITATGGKTPYQYSIDQGKTFQNSNVFKNLAGGQNYIITVKDSKGNKSQDAWFWMSTVYNPVTISFANSTATSGAATEDGEISTGAFGGTGDIVFSIDNGNHWQAASTFTSLAAGTYTLIARDINGCTSATKTVEVKAGKDKDDKIAEWTGKEDTNWSNKKNWKSNKLPEVGQDILIKKTSNDPVIGEGDLVTVGKMEIKTDAMLTINGQLNITEQITAPAGSINGRNGTIEIKSNSDQELDGNIFRENALKNLFIQSNVSLKGVLNIFGVINFKNANSNLKTNDLLTLKSNAQGTASVGKLSNNKIFGKVTVENYIAARKGWKFLSIPTSSDQSVKNAWQEGQSDNINNMPGWGTQITGEMGDWKAKGFDTYSFGPSVKTYNSNKNVWEGIQSTLNGFTDTSNAYMIFVRGDRSATGLASPVNATTLRTKGELNSGTQRVYDIQPAKFIAVGNPYASPLDISKINVKPYTNFYIWNPMLGNNYGAYQTVTALEDGNFVVVPSTANLNSNNLVIENGQAFFVYNEEGTTLQISEDTKLDLNTPGQSIRTTARKGSQGGNDNLLISLFTVNNGNKNLVDGVFQIFNESYNNGFDEMDALKNANTGENLSVFSDKKNLAIESRSFSGNSDTTQLNLTGVQYQNYQFEISLNQKEIDREAVLYDRFTGKSTPVPAGKATTYDFTVNTNAASYAKDRFLIIFRPLSIMPVTFTKITAEKNQDQVKVNWKIENEENVKEYSIEKSVDGVSFLSIGMIAATHSNEYTYNDANPVSGVNYYRIVSNDIDGKKGYSSIAKVVVDMESHQELNVYPNPIAGNSINLNLKSNVRGMYYISVKNAMGQIIDNRKVNFSGSVQSLEIVPSSKLTSGVYTIDVTNPSGEHITTRFVK